MLTLHEGSVYTCHLHTCDCLFLVASGTYCALHGRRLGLDYNFFMYCLDKIKNSTNNNITCWIQTNVDSQKHRAQIQDQTDESTGNVRVPVCR